MVTKLADNEGINFPEAVFDMDDYVEQILKKKQLNYVIIYKISQSGEFYFRKWSANDLNLLRDLNSENRKFGKNLKNKMGKILGILWYRKKMYFSIKCKI